MLYLVVIILDVVLMQPVPTVFKLAISMICSYVINCMHNDCGIHNVTLLNENILLTFFTIACRKINNLFY